MGDTAQNMNFDARVVKTVRNLKISHIEIQIIVIVLLQQIIQMKIPLINQKKKSIYKI